jgi:hypothetical protein
MWSLIIRMMVINSTARKDRRRFSCDFRLLENFAFILSPRVNESERTDGLPFA